MHNKVKLSVVIAIYNKENYLNRLFEAISKQELEGVEWILVDDGSIDSSPQMCDLFAGTIENVNVIHKENGGPISARDIGIKAAIGEYVSFVDGDDYFDFNMFSELYKPIEMDDSIDLVIGSYVLDNNGYISERFGYADPMLMTNRMAMEALFGGAIFDWANGGKIYKKELIETFSQWWDDRSFGEDIEFNWKAIKNANKIYYVPCHGYHYCNNLDSITHRITSISCAPFLRFSHILKDIDNDLMLFQTILNRAYPDAVWYLKKIYSENEETANVQELWKFIADFGEKYWKKKTYEEAIVQEWTRYSIGRARSLFYQTQDIIIRECNSFSEGLDAVYVYGVGRVAGNTANFFEKYGIRFDGFITTKACEKKAYYGRSVDSFSNLKNSEKIGVFLALNEKNSVEVRNNLKAQAPQIQYYDLSQKRQFLKEFLSCDI